MIPANLFAPENAALALAVWVALALGALTVAVLFQVLVLSELSNRQQRLRREFDAVWRPRLALASVADHPVARRDAPAAAEQLWFLLLWNRTQRQLRGAARARLNRMLLEFGLERFALSLLQRSDVRARLVALGTLRNLGDHAHWAAIQPLVRDPSPFLSFAAAEALVAIDPGRAMALLLPLARQRPDWTMQRVATLCLQAGPEAVTVPLLKELDRSGHLGGNRLTELVRWADPAQVARWSRTALDTGGDTRQRQAALQSLGELRDPHDRPRLLQALSDEDPDVRLCALQALRRQATAGDDEVLVRLLADRSWWVRQEAANGLVALPGSTRDRMLALIDRVADRYGRDALQRALAERPA
ncbi:HEAT repeat domain-containing protein [Cognatilysobacter tabacisoli]|uniref:HEAT repeat domain-containing protein n=1 Tax=Cognatilysobacter tabacisoli TaxID=2315424 RepID=UPI0018C876A8|nr:HEAT repeat domain-containing protein [Lysobacter tabacisoli]